ncbi:hypothetical protein O0L34_g14684 [Tuta absoluta]|nr:hypothetical protein O0L34_g14684 [Tuta absoluta]
MDYAVGSVAALISGNVTPNRPRLIRRALTPTKHQSSPNVTPKSELCDDRSIFLSPSLQKKKAIVKKSPKRIFENPDLDMTNDGEGSALLSPKADKVKKHLKEELEADEKISPKSKSPKSPKKEKLNKSIESKSPKKKLSISENDDEKTTQAQNINESTPKKKKNKKSLVAMPVEDEKENLTEQTTTTKAEVSIESNKSPKKKRKSLNTQDNSTTDTNSSKQEHEDTPKKKKKKNSESQESESSSKEEIKPQSNNHNQQKSKKKKNKKRKNKNDSQNNEAAGTAENINQDTESTKSETEPKKKIKKPKGEVNPNAITNKDSDSEHESDDEIQSENEETNNEILNKEAQESSDDEEEKVEDKKQDKQDNEGTEKSSKEEIERTLFVGNVPFSKKVKKEIKKVFDKYGVIETVRIRNVPVKDARMTPKVAAIKNELHPERTTVNVYIRFDRASAVAAALAENNTVFNNYHLRVTRSDSAGKEHDPNKAVFVGNMPFNIEDETLRAKFESCGEIESVRIVRDNKTGAGKGFGYVNFVSKDGVELALALSEEDLTIKNRIMRVKRCTFASNRPKQAGRDPGPRGVGQKGQGRSQGMKRRMQDGGGNPGNFGRNQGNFNRNLSMDRTQGGFGRNQSNFGRPQGNFGKPQGNFGRSQGNFGKPQGNFGRQQANFGSNQGFGRPQANEDKSLGQDGAHRRILKKRHNEAPNGGPPNKRPNINQPAKDKKPRKEFVGMTAEKKKKQKFNKGDKKKRALSEILTKHNSDK